MDRTTRTLFLGVLLVLVVITAGAAVASGLGAPPVAGSPPPGALQTEGVVVGIDSAGLAAVHGFTLRLPGGDTMDFRLDRLENGTTFAPGHLSEHQAASGPVRVWYVDEGGVHYAVWLEDAPS